MHYLILQAMTTANNLWSMQKPAETYITLRIVRKYRYFTESEIFKFLSQPSPSPPINEHTYIHP